MDKRIDLSKMGREHLREGIVRFGKAVDTAVRDCWHRVTHRSKRQAGQAPQPTQEPPKGTDTE